MSKVNYKDPRVKSTDVFPVLFIFNAFNIVFSALI